MAREEPFEQRLAGGHPNSLGATLQVVEVVLADRSRLHELYRCYFSPDEVVRLRVSSAMKRIAKEHPDWLVPYLDGLLTDVAAIDQASAQWTLAQLFPRLEDAMTPEQKERAVSVLKKNLSDSDDWIVLVTTMETLAVWACDDPALRSWLVPRLEPLVGDRRKSVAGRARKVLGRLSTPGVP